MRRQALQYRVIFLGGRPKNIEHFSWVAVQLGKLAGLGEILLAFGQGCLAGRCEAGPGELLLAVHGGLLLGCDEARVASRTRGGLHPLPPFSFNFIVATRWFVGFYSFPQAVWGELGGPTVAGDLSLGRSVAYELAGTGRCQ